MAAGTALGAATIAGVPGNTGAGAALGDAAAGTAGDAALASGPVDAGDVWAVAGAPAAASSRTDAKVQRRMTDSLRYAAAS